MSIQEHLNKIRNAVYGHEVRESIANGIETAYDDASENGNANMEVKIARGTHPNLRSRLDETTAQLQQSEQKLSSQLADKVGGGVKAEPEDLSATTLGLITGTGGPINLLSIPQDKSVTPEKTSFLSKNVVQLFEGNYYHNFSLAGDPKSDYILQPGTRTGVVVPVEPNTTYTFIKEATPKEGGYYWTKLQTSTFDYATVKQWIANGTTATLDGVVLAGAEIDVDITLKTFTTGPNDHTLIMLVAYVLEPRVQILKGTYTDFQVDTFMPDQTQIEVAMPADIDTAITGFNQNKNYIRVSCAGNGGDIRIWKRNDSGNFTSYQISKLVDEATAYSGYKFLYIGFKYANDTWRYNLRTGIECEGAILEKGAADFVGGLHGDETQTAAEFVIDGVRYDLNDVWDVYGQQIDFITQSTVYHCNTTNVAFDRTKRIRWKDDTMTIYNNFYTVSDFYVTTAALAMMTANNTNTDESLIGYCTNKDFVYKPTPIYTVDKDIESSVFINESTLFGTNGMSISCKLVDGSLSNPKGTITQFGDRLKMYNHPMTDTQLNVGDRLWSVAEFKLTI